MSAHYSIRYCRKDPGTPFVEGPVAHESPEFEDQDLGPASSERGELIYLAEQENVGFVHYEHWRNGQLLRRLKYNDDGGWLSADGTPEPWEIDQLFSPEHLAQALKNNDPETHDGLKALWERKEIRAGENQPMLGCINLVQLVRLFWGL